MGPSAKSIHVEFLRAGREPLFSYRIEWQASACSKKNIKHCNEISRNYWNLKYLPPNRAFLLLFLGLIRKWLNVSKFGRSQEVCSLKQDDHHYEVINSHCQGKRKTLILKGVALLSLPGPGFNHALWGLCIVQLVVRAAVALRQATYQSSKWRKNAFWWRIRHTLKRPLNEVASNIVNHVCYGYVDLWANLTKVFC